MVELEDYIVSLTSPEPEYLKRLTRETYLNILMPNMLSGHLQGRFLSLMSHMIRPQNILEIGTFTGYSALCFAEGLTENGKLTTIDINEELEDMVRRYIKEADMEDKVFPIYGNALGIIPELREVFDVVFIDADKVNYSQYYDLVINKIRPGGFIIADNVLWKGKVLNLPTDKDTRAIVEFNQKIYEDARVDNTIINIRDGLMIIRKK